MHAATDTRGEGGIRNCELQRNKRNLDRPFKLLSETSDFGNFTIENLYRVSRKKKEIRSFGLFRYYGTRFIL